MRRPDARRASRLAPLLALLACATSGGGAQGVHAAQEAPTTSERWAALVADPDRPAQDRALDPGRKPAELLAFSGVRAGMRVAELGAGGGYTTELLARAVGPTGTVFSQNPPRFIPMVGDAWTKRLARPALARVIRVERDFDDPLPPEARGLDLVVMHAIYHDTIWLGTDRAAMNRAIFDALVPGGAFVVVDSSAAAGAGDAAARELHRVDEARVRDEVTAAGFRLAAASDAWRNPQDARDWNASPGAAGERRGTSDRFAFRFVKP